MSTRPQQPQAGEDEPKPHAPGSKERGSNAVEHQPDPSADPLPDGEHKYVPRSPYTTGND